MLKDLCQYFKEFPGDIRILWIELRQMRKRTILFGVISVVILFTTLEVFMFMFAEPLEPARQTVAEQGVTK